MCQQSVNGLLVQAKRLARVRRHGRCTGHVTEAPPRRLRLQWQPPPPALLGRAEPGKHRCPSTFLLPFSHPAANDGVTSTPAACASGLLLPAPTHRVATTMRAVRGNSEAEKQGPTKTVFRADWLAPNLNYMQVMQGMVLKPMMLGTADPARRSDLAWRKQPG